MLRYYGYAAKTVSSMSVNGHWLSHCISMVTKHAAYGKLFWNLIVFTRRAFWDHCQQNWSIFTCLTSTELRSWPLTFLWITTKRYVVDRSNCTFFLNPYNKRNLLVWSLTKLKQLLKLTPVQTVWNKAMWNINPWPLTNRTKLCLARCYVYCPKELLPMIEHLTSGVCARALVLVVPFYNRWPVYAW